AGHAVALPPQALTAPLDGGEDGRSAAQRHGSRERGRLGGRGGYGLTPRSGKIETTTPRVATPLQPEVFLTTSSESVLPVDGRRFRRGRYAGGDEEPPDGQDFSDRHILSTRWYRRATSSQSRWSRNRAT